MMPLHLTDQIMDRRTDQWMDGRMDGWMDGWMDGRTDGRMDGWTDGWMDGQMDAQMGGWMDGSSNECVLFSQNDTSYRMMVQRLIHLHFPSLLQVDTPENITVIGCSLIQKNTLKSQHSQKTKTYMVRLAKNVKLNFSTVFL